MNLKKGISLLSLIGTLLSSPTFADGPKRHPLYPQGDPKRLYAEQMPKSIEAVVGKCGEVSVDQVEQSIYVNIPGFYLRLENKVGDQVCSTFTFPIRAGRHWEKHFGKVVTAMETPVGEGTIDEKRWSGTFRYFDDVWKTRCVRYDEDRRHRKVCVEKKKVLVHRKGDIIRETSTFTDEGKPMIVPIEYNWMHSLGMKLVPEGKKSYTTRCVIHATSHCCVGLRIDDMLRLYGLVLPDQERGEARRNVRLRTDYTVVERSGTDLVLHADVYDRKMNYVGLVQEALGDAGFIRLNEQRVREEVQKAEEQFAEAYPFLRKKLLTDKFITREEVGRLHYQIPMKELVE